MSDPARNRFLLIQLARFGGVALAMLGLVLSQRLATTPEKVAAVVMILIGLAITALLPRALARRWRSPQ